MDEKLLQGAVSDATSVLLLAPSTSRHSEQACASLLTIDDPTEGNLLCMTFTDPPERRLESWQTHGATLPSHVGIVGVGDNLRAESNYDADGGELVETDHDETVRIDWVADAGDLPRIGITLSEHLTDWMTGSGKTVVCFDSVTALLQYADLQRVYRFLHTLKGRLNATDAVAHFHMDPTAHDAQTLATLRPLFDVIIEVDDAGTVTVSDT